MKKILLELAWLEARKYRKSKISDHRVFHHFSGKILSQLKILSLKARVTQPSVLIAVYVVLVHRYFKRNSIKLMVTINDGTPFLMKCRLTNNQSFDDLLIAIQKNYAEVDDYTASEEVLLKLRIKIVKNKALLSCYHQPELISEFTRKNLAKHYEQLIKCFASDPAQNIDA